MTLYFDPRSRRWLILCNLCRHLLYSLTPHERWPVQNTKGVCNKCQWFLDQGIPLTFEYYASSL